MFVPDLTHRANLDEVTELMDGPCSYEELRDCLHSLSVFNRISSGYDATFDFLNRALASDIASAPVRILDLGCGYGDYLRRIERWAAARHLPVELLGVDLNPQAIRAAREATPKSSHIQFLAGDATALPEAQQADFVLASLVMHHVPDPGIIALLAWMDRTARRGWFISDIHRMPMPYMLFSVFMRGPWWQRFIRPDGLASIRRAFRDEDWMRMAEAAGIEPVTLRHYRPARLCVERLRK